MDSDEDIIIHFYLSEILKGNDSVLNYEDMYKNHVGVIREIIRKRIIYSEDYIQDLKYQFSEVFNNIEDVVRLLYSIPIKDNEHNNSILGKLKADIFKETEFLEYMKKV